MTRKSDACCSVCGIRQLQDTELLIRFDSAPFSSEGERLRFLAGTMHADFRALLEQNHFCSHGSRVHFRFLERDRAFVGSVLRERAEASRSERLGVYADLVLEEGAFHPSRRVLLSTADL